MAKSKSIPTPGALLQAILNKYKMDCAELADELKCSRTELRLITLDQARITIPMAMSLGKFFKVPPEYWLVLQMEYSLSLAEKEKSLTAALKCISTVDKFEAKRKAQEAKVKTAKKKTSKKKETLADKRKKAAKVPGAKRPSRKTK